MASKQALRGAWGVDGIFVLEGSVVGTVSESGRGRWFAHGCDVDWEDVNLGCHESEKKARKAVEDWVKP